MKDIVKLEINTPALSFYIEEGGKTALRKEAGEGIIKITEAIDLLQKGLEQVKELMRKNGIETYGVVPSVKYKNLSIFEKEVGDKYTTSNPKFIKKSKREWADSKKIEGYLEETGVLPDNTVKNERKKTLVIVKK